VLLASNLKNQILEKKFNLEKCVWENLCLIFSKTHFSIIQQTAHQISFAKLHIARLIPIKMTTKKMMRGMCIKSKRFCNSIKRKN